MQKATTENSILYFCAAACPSLVNLNFYLGFSSPGIEELELFPNLLPNS